jgi:mRNA-degrading endonuclease RelE of RelBE toxin-antitoxin system
MMQNSLTLSYSEEAFLDLLEAVKWYNKIEKGLGKRLKSEIKNIETNIKSNPTFASIKYKNVRAVACKIFPYAVHYEIDLVNNKILITSIFHSSKEPNW